MRNSGADPWGRWGISYFKFSMKNYVFLCIHSSFRKLSNLHPLPLSDTHAPYNLMLQPVSQHQLIQRVPLPGSLNPLIT